MYTVIALEQDPKWKNLLEYVFSMNGADSTFVSSRHFLNEALCKKAYDAVIVDVSKEPDLSLPFLKQMIAEYPDLPFIVVSYDANPDFIVSIMRAGAYDFICKPYSEVKICRSVLMALEKRSLLNERDYLRRSQDILYRFEDLVSESPNMKKVIAELKKFSETDALILMTGETGTGKSFMAGTVHFNSKRKQHPFVAINCANISETLLESELFGHEIGAFVEADKLRIGRFEQAKYGTVFLDEIGELSNALQAKLLRVIEEKRFERVGGNRTLRADVRFIAATHRNLAKCIADNTFRRDLYYRLKVLLVHLPPLRERRQCILPLGYCLLKKISRSLKKSVTDFSDEVKRAMLGYHWPGNIRELANSIERAVILEDSDMLQIDNFPVADEETEAASCNMLKGDEKEIIVNALEENFWIQKDAALSLGISPRCLNYKIKKYGITHHRWRVNK